MILVEQISKHYGDFRAVDEVSFQVRPGEIVGFLGPNGAGKSTLLKMLCTWLPPSSGRASIAGHDVQRDPLGARCQLGYLTEHNALYEGMVVSKFLRFAGKLRGLLGTSLKQRFDWVVEACTLGDVLDRRIAQCSKGYRQRIGLAAALIHDPPVILLDEPTHGLDPIQVVAFREFLRSLSEGRAILFSSHNLAEVASITDRLLVLNRGQLLTDAPLSELQAAADANNTDLEGHVLGLVRAAGDAHRGAARGSLSGADS